MRSEDVRKWDSTIIQAVVSAPASVSRNDVRFDELTLPAIPVLRSPERSPQRSQTRWYHDRWLVALVICAACASLGAAIWAYQSQTILLYGDAHSHLLVARRVFDGVNPGLAQLGDVWLPLPHIIMVPLAWNDFLWQTGLAGTFTSMPCYVTASVYVFLTARRLTHDSRASFIGSLVFVANPNILYLQSTPLSEPVLFATLAATSYYFVAWAQDDQLRNLVYSALATFLATVARYDGWALYLAITALLVIICWRKGFPRDKTLGYTMLFSILGGVGILLWFVWNLVIFGSPTAFLSGSFSSQTQTKSFIQEGYADTYHNVWQSIQTYSVATMESIGPVIFVLGVVAIAFFLNRRRLSNDALAATTLLIPFAFYVVAFFLGQDVMYIPHANHPPYYLYNARFGAEMAAPAAVFVSTLVESAQRWLPSARVVLLAAILGQSVVTSWGGVISLQDGQVGLSCYPGHPIAAVLAQHYDGGRILLDVYHSQIDLAAAGVTFRDEIYEGDGKAWTAALHNPSRYVEWIITAPHDLISQQIDIQGTTFHRNYIPIVEESVTGETLWHLNDHLPLPTRALSSNVIAPYLACNHAKGVPIGEISGGPLAFMPRDNMPARLDLIHTHRPATVVNVEDE
jgi:hypothetical protein